ncbi:MAG: TonB-dependent receptor [Bacteroidales bacterium]|nr:TonB-dependent receptor [Bacteroidales bacterium]
MEKIFPKRLVTSLLALIAIVTLGGHTYAQTNVTGKVTAASDGSPVIGAGVVVLGTSVGTMTEADGTYSMMLPTGTTELSVVCLGYKTVTEQINGRSVINFVLEEEFDALDDVVVVGYGVQKKKLITGANLNVKGEDLMKRSTGNALQALQGQTPGMQITSTSGQPGEGMKVTIRGLGTTGSAGPLYIVDGVPGDISKVNPADIESIDVLKDAASAAIYGSQAANGVVLVTTKTGQAGQAHVYFDGYYGVQTVYRQARMLNADQYMTIMDEQALNSGQSVYDWSQYNLADTDWVGQMFRNTAPTQNYTVGVTGGNDASVYALSFNYTNQEGIVGNKEKSSVENYRVRLNSEHKIYKDLFKVGEHMTFVYGNSAGIGVGNQYNNTLRGAFGTSPLAHVYGNNYYGWGDENGIWNDSDYNTDDFKNWYNGDGNPYAAMMLGRSTSSSQNFIGDIYAELTPVKGLSIKSTIGFSHYSSNSHGIGFNSRWNVYGGIPSTDADYYASVSQSLSSGYSFSWINTATYQTTIAEDHNISAMIGSEWDTNYGEWVSGNNKISVEQFKDFEHAWLNNGSDDKTYWGKPSGNVNDIDKTMSAFARMGYNYKEKYMANATFRADGSSKFAKGNRWGFFPSVSAGWVMTSEDWMQDVKGLDFLKLRASWGQVGNKNISNYAYTAPISTNKHTYTFGTNFGADLGSAAETPGAVQERLANTDVKWETSEQLDFGADARFLDSRLSVNADWYRKITRDWLVTAPIPATAGTGAPYINGGDVTNTGVELALNWNDRIGDFNYYVGVNGAYNKNVVGEIPNADGIIHGETNQLFDNSKEFYRAQNGHSIGYWWGLQTDGIFQNEKEIRDHIAAGNGVLQANPQPGDVRFVDQNHDGVIDDSDKIDLGNGMPDVTYGFNLGFDWKGLDFNVTAYGSAGAELVQSYRNMTNVYANYTTAILDRWHGEGTSNRIPRVTNSNINYAEFSDLFLHDGSFLRISNITLGYDFARLARAEWLSQARLYVSVQNAFTFTKYEGMDPEIGYGTSGWCSGIDLGFYPHPRIFLVGINLQF